MVLKCLGGWTGTVDGCAQAITPFLKTGCLTYHPAAKDPIDRAFMVDNLKELVHMFKIIPLGNASSSLLTKTVLHMMWTGTYGKGSLGLLASQPTNLKLYVWNSMEHPRAWDIIEWITKADHHIIEKGI